MAKRKQTTRTALARRARTNLAALPQEAGIIGVFQRLATDPKITVDKLGELIKLQERIMDREAAAAFETAYALMLPEIPHITKKGKILNKQGDVQSRYSRYEDIRRVTDPILRRFGFVIHYSTTYPTPGLCEVTGTLVHTNGGTKISRFQSAPDDSGGKNRIQGMGSANSYGKRYVRKDLLQIVEEGQDDDGQAAGRATAADRRAPPQTPAPGDPPAHHANVGEPITAQARRRIVALVQNSGRTDKEVLAWLKRRYGWAGTMEITRNKYEEICAAIERPGDLP